MLDHADVGHDITVSGFEHCDRCGHEYNVVVHIWRQCNLDEKRACRCCIERVPILFAKELLERGERVDGFFHWTEGDGLATLLPSLDLFVALAQRPGRMLVHCSHGQCRSATLAMVAKVVRGASISQAIGDVFEGVHRDRRFAPLTFYSPIQNILAWAEARS
jgi:hypothetical protein